MSLERQSLVGKAGVGLSPEVLQGDFLPLSKGACLDDSLEESTFSPTRVGYPSMLPVASAGNPLTTSNALLESLPVSSDEENKASSESISRRASPPSRKPKTLAAVLERMSPKSSPVETKGNSPSVPLQPKSNPTSVQNANGPRKVPVFGKKKQRPKPASQADSARPKADSPSVYTVAINAPTDGSPNEPDALPVEAGQEVSTEKPQVLVDAESTKGSSLVDKDATKKKAKKPKKSTPIASASIGQSTANELDTGKATGTPTSSTGSVVISISPCMPPPPPLVKIKKVSTAEEKAAEKEEKRVMREAKKRENEQKKIELEQKKQERAVLKQERAKEKQQKRMEIEKRKEQRRLAAEQRKAEKEQKRIERELKKAQPKKKGSKKKSPAIQENQSPESKAAETPPPVVKTPPPVYPEQSPESKAAETPPPVAKTPPPVYPEQPMEVEFTDWDTEPVADLVSVDTGSTYTVTVSSGDDSADEETGAALSNEVNAVDCRNVANQLELPPDKGVNDQVKKVSTSSPRLGITGMAAHRLSIPGQPLSGKGNKNNNCNKVPSSPGAALKTPVIKYSHQTPLILQGEKKPAKVAGEDEEAPLQAAGVGENSQDKSTKKKRARQEDMEGASAQALTPIKRSRLELNVSGPVWVQCADISCHKWRKLNEYDEPSQVPKAWVCPMNQDKKHNSCFAPQEQWDVKPNEEFVETVFIPGTVVWAKADGFPWWPGMIEADPDLKTFYQLGKYSDSKPVKYHVVYFDTPVSRNWLDTHRVMLFSDIPDANKAARVKVNKKYKKELNASLKMASRALNFTRMERIVKFNFIKRHKADQQKLDKSKAKISEDEVEYSPNYKKKCCSTVFNTGLVAAGDAGPSAKNLSGTENED